MQELWRIFLTFFKIGMFTLGGGYAMLPLIQREVVEKSKWVDNREFIELLALAQTSPGPMAINAAVFVGYKHRGIVGSLTACLGMTLPSFLIILIIAMYLASFRENQYVESFFKGIRPAVVALIAAPLCGLGKAIKIAWWGVLLAALIAIAIAYAGISPAIMVVIAALIGLFSGMIRKKSREKKDAAIS
ncbi:MAG: chromate transporter [Candidatus Riflebacteria bacterium HGW-Riflebacteria-2]|jgi:chromate transporter|nr:MAG: chromate transporter [Candidatus Riflebacteria bacterium HGW-Riflebacteria-2]